MILFDDFLWWFSPMILSDDSLWWFSLTILTDDPHWWSFRVIPADDPTSSWWRPGKTTKFAKRVGSWIPELFDSSVLPNKRESSSVYTSNFHSAKRLYTTSSLPVWVSHSEKWKTVKRDNPTGSCSRLMRRTRSLLGNTLQCQFHGIQWLD